MKGLLFKDEIVVLEAEAITFENFGKEYFFAQHICLGHG